MDEEKEERDWLRIILPRILKATLWGLIMGGEILIPLVLVPGKLGELGRFIPVEQTGITSILIVFVAFEVAIQLLSGTILRYPLSVVRTMVSMSLLLVFTNGGTMTLAMPIGVLPPQAGTMLVTVDLRTMLAALLILSLLSIVKNVLQALDFLSEKAEEPITLPEPP